MSTESTNTIVLVGYGQMGQFYLNLLLNELSIDPATVIVVDIDLARLQACNDKFPAVRTTTDLADALKGGVHVLFNLTNSPSHLSVFRAAVAAGVPYVFAEKPIVPICDLDELLDMDFGSTEIVAGYVINFSGAVKQLMDLCEREKLDVWQCLVRWGKDRTKDKRPTAGVVDDEMPHGLELFRLLLDGLGNMTLQAHIDSQSFADQEVQRKAMEMDSSFVLNPPAAVQVSAVGQEDDFCSTLMMDISYVRRNQVREVTFVLGTDGASDPSHIAKLTFDTDIGGGKKGDILEIGPVEGEQERLVFGNNKLLDMMRSFFAFTRGEERDPRLTTMSDAIRNAEFAQKVAESGAKGGLEVWYV